MCKFISNKIAIAIRGIYGLIWTRRDIAIWGSYFMNKDESVVLLGICFLFDLQGQLLCQYKDTSLGPGCLGV